MPRLEELGRKHGVELESARVPGPKRLTVLIVESDRTEAVRDSLQERGIVQWDDTEFYPSQTMMEAMRLVRSLAPIW